MKGRINHRHNHRYFSKKHRKKIILGYYPHRYFTRVITPEGADFRAELGSWGVMAGGSDIWFTLKSRIRPKINVPEYCITIRDNWFYFPMRREYLQNKFVDIIKKIALKK